MQEQQAKSQQPISNFSGVSLPIPRDYVLR